MPFERDLHEADIDRVMVEAHRVMQTRASLRAGVGVDSPTRNSQRPRPAGDEAVSRRTPRLRKGDGIKQERIEIVCPARILENGPFEEILLCNVVVRSGSTRGPQWAWLGRFKPLPRVF